MPDDKAALEPSQEVEQLTGEERQEWLKTGELPSDKPTLVVTEEPKEKAEEPVEEPEQTNFKQPAQSAKSKSPGQMGYRELRDKVTELERKLAEATTRTEPPEPARTPITTTEPKEKTAERTKPTPTDKDEKGEAKYKSYEDYLEDLTDWKAEQRIIQYDKERTEKAAKAQVEQQQTAVSRQWAEQVDAARTKHADFDTVALNKDLPIPPGSAIEQFVLANLESGLGAEMLYHLGQNPEEVKAINAMTPVEAARRLVLLEAELTEPDEPSTPAPKRVSDAPPPVREAGNRHATNYDPADEALAEGDFEKYRKAQNAKELARVRRG
jgi:hypothetical protein